MVRIPFTHVIEVSTEKFIDACDLTQLYELELLLNKRLNKLESEMGIQDMDRAAMKHKCLTKKRED